MQHVAWPAIKHIVRLLSERTATYTRARGWPADLFPVTQPHAAQILYRWLQHMTGSGGGCEAGKLTRRIENARPIPAADCCLYDAAQA